MAVIQCPRCFQKYRVQSEAIGNHVTCTRPGCHQSFKAAEIPPPAVEQPEIDEEPPDGNGPTGSGHAPAVHENGAAVLAASSSTPTTAIREAIRRSAERKAVGETDDEGANRSQVEMGRLLFWFGILMTGAAICLPTHVEVQASEFSSGRYVHHLPSAAGQLVLSLLGGFALVSGASLIGSGRGKLLTIERLLVILWAFLAMARFVGGAVLAR